MPVQVIGNGVYSFGEAALLTGVSYRCVRAWFCGERGKTRKFIHSDYKPSKVSGGLISFHDLIDTLIVGKLRKAKMSLQYLRKVHDKLLHEFEIRHPFCWKKLLTDGKHIFIYVANELGEEQLLELFSRQGAFPQILLPILNQIDYDPTTLLARRWSITPGVIIDPARQRGKPLVESVGIPTAILGAAYEANEHDTKAVARWYGITQKEVRLAVEFEASVNRPAA